MNPDESSYNLEKTVWSETDFEQMGWHDVHVHGISFGPEYKEHGTADFILDIDYIFEWIKPIPPERFFKNWVAPCTLVFEGAYDLKIEIDDKIGYALGPFEIDDLSIVERLQRDGTPYGYLWRIQLQTGWLELKSNGYKQYVRQKPSLNGLWLTFAERNGISFSKNYLESSK